MTTTILPATTLRRLALFIGPLLGVVVALLMLQAGWSKPPAFVAAVTSLCAIWWIFEAVPLPITSLVPMALFPPLAVLDHQSVALAYGSPLILLMLGGFICRG